MPAINIHPTHPLPEPAEFAGASGVWDYATNNPAWKADAEGFRNSWPVGATLGAAFPESGNISVTDVVTPSSLSVPAGVHQAIEASGAGEVSLSPHAIVSADIGGTLWITGNGLRLPTQTFIKSGPGHIGVSRLLQPQGATPTVAILEGAIHWGVEGAGTSATIPNPVSVFENADILFDTAKNVNLTGGLTGSGRISIAGGGHILVNGVDAGSRNFTPPAGFTGTFDTPEVNVAPVLSAPSPLADSAVSVAGTNLISATDADGDTVTLSVIAGSGTLDADNRTFRFSSSTSGEYSVTLRGEDGYGGVTDLVVKPFVYDYKYSGSDPRVNFGTGTVSTNSTYRVNCSPRTGGTMLVCQYTFSGSPSITLEGELGLGGLLTGGIDGHLHGYPSLWFDKNSSAFSGTISLPGTSGAPGAFASFAGVGDPTSASTSSASLGSSVVTVSPQSSNFVFWNCPQTLATRFSRPGAAPFPFMLTFVGGTYTLDPASVPYGATKFSVEDANHFLGASVNTSVVFASLVSGLTLSGATASASFTLPANPSLASLTIELRPPSGSNYTAISWTGNSSGVPTLRHYGVTLPAPTLVAGKYVWVYGGATYTLNPSAGLSAVS